MRKSILWGAAVTLCCLVSFTGTANATSITPGIDFSGGSGGSITFNGTTFNITGAPITQVENLRTSSMFPVSGGILDIITANCIQNCSVSHPRSTDVFANGGLLEIFGTVLGTSGLLLKGTFDANQGLPQFGQNPCPSTTVTLNGNTHRGGFRGCLDVTNINSTLLADLGFAPFLTRGNGYLSQVLVNINWNGTSFSGSVGSSDLGVTPAAEPASLALLGAGLLILGGLAKKKLLPR
jgi:hypothetical protein